MSDYIIYTAGSCDNSNWNGGWAYRILDGSGSAITSEKSDALDNVTSPSLELIAVINSLDECNDKSRIELRTTSDYVLHGLNSVEKWERQDWERPINEQDPISGQWVRSKITEPIPNDYLWSKILAHKKRLCIIGQKTDRSKDPHEKAVYKAAVAARKTLKRLVSSSSPV